jgi:hypothetical protein
MPIAPLCGEDAEDEWLRRLVQPMASLWSGHHPFSGLPLPVAMERPFDSLFFALPVDDQRALLERALAHDCDIDPLILRGRLLRQRGSHTWALAVDQELLPLF